MLKGLDTFDAQAFLYLKTHTKTKTSVGSQGRLLLMLLSSMCHLLIPNDRYGYNIINVV